MMEFFVISVVAIFFVGLLLVIKDVLKHSNIKA